MDTANYSVGDKVTFGRKQGEKTLGTVVKVNRRRLKVRQDEARGAMKSHAVGTIWTVPPSLVNPANGSAVPAPVTPALAVPYRPAPEFRKGDRVEFDARGRTIVGLVRQVNAKTVSVQPDGAGSRYWRVSPGMLRKANGSAPAPKVKRPDAEILRDIDGVYGELSPENLTCDGEASPAWVRRRAASLRARLRELEAEIGRKVSEEELWVR